MKKEIKKIGLKKKIVLLLDNKEQLMLKAGGNEEQAPTLCGSCPTVDSTIIKTTTSRYY